MTITFFSNYLNHHQLPLCLEFMKNDDIDFKFVATERISKERLALGYDDMNQLYDFVVRTYENDDEAYKLGIESDVVIFGCADRKYIKNRLKTKKLTFWYSERIYKKGFNIKTWLSLIKNYAFLSSKSNYLLCASSYCAADYNLSFSFINRTIKWGYFPKTYTYDIDKLINKKINNKKIEILWVGRFIDWKHPEKIIEIAKKLKNTDFNFSIKMIGTGPMLDSIKKNILEEKLINEIELVGAVNNEVVRDYMIKANIYIFTSDYNEGWGAVLNEAMNSGCAIIASHAIGSVPFMIKNNYNGVIYNNDDANDLYNKLYNLIIDKQKQKQISINAYNTIKKYWNAEYASIRFIDISKHLLKNNILQLKRDNVPCTNAPFILQNKMYKYLSKGNDNDK